MCIESKTDTKMSCVTCHLLHVMYHKSPVTFFDLPTMFKLKLLEARNAGIQECSNGTDNVENILLDHGSTDCPCFFVRVASFDNSL